VLLALGLLVLVTGCTSSSVKRTGSTTASQGTNPPATVAPSGPVRILDTPDTEHVMAIAVKAIRSSQPQLDVQLTTSPAPKLQAAASTTGAAIVISSDRAELGALASADVTYQPVAFIRTKLQLVVAPNDPLGIRTLADLDRPDVRVVLLTSSTSTGRATQQLIGANGLTIDVVGTVASPAAAVTAITAGGADATVLEVGDAVAAGSTIRAFDIPDDQNVITQYSLALVRSAASGPQAAPAQEVASALLDGPGSQALLSAHYLLPALAASTPGTDAGT
jgi:molybdate transport system substrate-binding protein